MTDDQALLCAIIVALARTWDAKLPGFLSEFQAQIDSIYVETPVSTELRATLDQLSRSLDKK